VTYPITVTRTSIVDAGADCDLRAAFDDVAPGGQLVIADVDAHVALLRGPLALYEHWAIEHGLMPPVVATAGQYGTATAGYRGTATAGEDGTATAGDFGTATAGDFGAATAGDAGTATAGYFGIATAGDDGIATAGDDGTATAGNGGTATAGDAGTATVGEGGTATAGDDGTATAGEGGIIQIYWYDGHRRRILVGYVGEAGLLPDVPYRVEVTDGAARFVRAGGGQ